MDIFEKLRLAVRRAQDEDDLPDYLAVRIDSIADLLPSTQFNKKDIEQLIEQLNQYDTYGQTGYLGMGVNHLILGKTLERIEELLGIKKAS